MTIAVRRDRRRPTAITSAGRCDGLDRQTRRPDDVVVVDMRPSRLRRRRRAAARPEPSPSTATAGDGARCRLAAGPQPRRGVDDRRPPRLPRRRLPARRPARRPLRRGARRAHPDAIACGPVRYLREGWATIAARRRGRLDALQRRASGAARPGRRRRAPRRRPRAVLVAQLRRATGTTWDRLGGFDEALSRLRRRGHRLRASGPARSASRWPGSAAAPPTTSGTHRRGSTPTHRRDRRQRPTVPRPVGPLADGGLVDELGRPRPRRTSIRSPASCARRSPSGDRPGAARVQRRRRARPTTAWSGTRWRSPRRPTTPCVRSTEPPADRPAVGRRAPTSSTCTSPTGCSVPTHRGRGRAFERARRHVAAAGSSSPCTTSPSRPVPPTPTAHRRLPPGRAACAERSSCGSEHERRASAESASTARRRRHPAARPRAAPAGPDADRRRGRRPTGRSPCSGSSTPARATTPSSTPRPRLPDDVEVVALGQVSAGPRRPARARSQTGTADRSALLRHRPPRRRGPGRSPCELVDVPVVPARRTVGVVVAELVDRRRPPTAGRAPTASPGAGGAGAPDLVDAVPSRDSPDGCAGPIVRALAEPASTWPDGAVPAPLRAGRGRPHTGAVRRAGGLAMTSS